MINKLKLLRTAGVNISIDDFGTGYSSLSRLAHLPIDTLKIDRSFISHMAVDADTKPLVAIIISIARAFGLVVVAEGVEQEEQLDALWQLGCDQSQGYLHSKPVPAQQFAVMLKASPGYNRKPAVEAQPLIAVRNVRASSRWYAELLARIPFRITSIATSTTGSSAPVGWCFSYTRGTRKTIPIS